MMEAAYLVLFALGFVLLVKGADMVTDHSASIARRFGISQLVIGITLVAFSTSLPELAVSLTSVLFKVSDIAVGTIVGSNIANIGLIIGLSALAAPLFVRKDFLREGCITMTFSLALTLLLLSGMVWYTGLFLILGLFAYMWYLLRKKPVKRGFRHKHEDFLDRITQRKNIIHLTFTLIGAGMVILGAYVLVRSTINIAQWLGVPEFVISLIAVAVGTSLPELVTSFVAALKKMRGISVGNIIGSNIFNISILGMASLFAPISAVSGIVLTDLAIMLFVTALLLVFMRTGWKISRKEGTILLLVYAFFLYIQFA